jgi:folate-binding protein YgfZ
MGADDNEAMNTDPTAAHPHGALRLTDWGVIRAQGDEAGKFLHGQLTQDALHLSPEAARLAGYCSAKGRLLATFVMWSRGPEEVLLACSADLLPAVLKRLAMFVLRARCKLGDASAEVPLFGLAGAGPWPNLDAPSVAAPWGRAVLAGRGDLIRLPDAQPPGVPAIQRHLLAGMPAMHGPEISRDAWNALEVYSGVGRIVAATAEQLVPQMINLELVGGVNFQKGCYPGQEVVARSQYRGTLKRRGFVVSSATLLQPGQEIFHSGDVEQPAGLVVLAGQLPNESSVALVELKIAALESGSLHAGSATGALLTPQPLPYELPTAAA